MRIVYLALQKVVPKQELRPRVFWRSYATIAWVSFLFAALASMLFFAAFDPVTLANIATYPTEIDALGIYTMGFFLFWVLCFSCTAFACVMLALPINKRNKAMPE